MKKKIAILSIICLFEVVSCTNTNKDVQQDDSQKAEHMQFKSGYADINGIKMYYEIYGEGKPLVLIHGGGSTVQTSFGRIIPELSKTHQIIALELQAHGRTSDRDADLSFKQDADDVASLMDNLNIEKADVLGFSNGGVTALMLAIHYPEKVDKIIAASALLKRDGTFPQFWEFMKGAKLEDMPQAYKDAFLEVTPDTIKLLAMHNKCAKRMVDFKDVTDEDLASIKADVLLVNADHDVATVQHLVNMAKLIPNCSIAVFPGGHGEYMGEITTLKEGKPNSLPILPVIQDFLQ